MTRFSLDQVLRSRAGRLLLVAALLGLALVAAAIAFNRRAARETVNDLSAVPFPIVESLPIAAKAQASDRSALRLVCTDDRQVLLVLRTKLAVGETFFTAGAEDRAELYVGDRKNRIETRMRLVHRDDYDTLVSTRLSATALGALGAFFGNDAPREVSVVTLETTTRLTGQSGKGQIATVAAACR